MEESQQPISCRLSPEAGHTPLTQQPTGTEQQQALTTSTPEEEEGAEPRGVDHLETCKVLMVLEVLKVLVRGHVTPVRAASAAL